MYKTISKSFLLIILLFLFGCTTTYKVGKMFNSANIKKIKIGITTQQDVLTMFGEPWREGLANGKDVFTYTFEEIVFDGNDIIERRGNTLFIEFDENRIVKNYYLNVPGKESTLLGVLIRKHKKDKEIEAVEQNALLMNQ